MSDLASPVCNILTGVEELKDIQEIERSLIKKYRKSMWGPFVKAVKEFEMINEGDKIAVCISGGKDSLALAKLLQEIQRHGDKKFELEFIAMNPGFYEENRVQLLKNCEILNIPVKMFETGIFNIVDRIAGDYPCYMCARMRRGSLYNYAKELGCNKIALGHHFNDVIETTMMNVLYSGNFKTMLPRLKAKNFENMELIRPMYYVEEEAIIAYTRYAGIRPMDCGCMVAAGKYSSKRKEIKDFIRDYKTIYKDVDKSIFSAATNVNIDSIVGWTKNGQKHSYIEKFDEIFE